MSLPITFREAVTTDLPQLLALLSDDAIAKQRPRREDRTKPAFAEILRDPNIVMLVAEAPHGAGLMIIACCQLTYTPHLTYDGGTRATIEGVRVDAARRGSGAGKALITEAIRLATERGCHMVQLTTDKRRPDAIRFYESLGFIASHEGMKLHL
ncbi:MAG: GNAT family N-acetyltransferase [Planctomycetota bacterium]